MNTTAQEILPEFKLTSVYKTCLFCGKQFYRPSRKDKSIDAGLYCSRKCGFAGQRHRGPKPKPQFSKVFFIQCECGWKTFKNARLRCKDCSYKRNLAKANAYQKQRYAAIYAARPTIAKHCQHCGKVFKPRLHQERIYCSARCVKQSHRRNSRHKHKVQRRERLKIGKVETVRLGILLHRDNYTCQICHKPVQSNKKVPHPKAPTIDHIIPLVDGGTHEYRNVQLAHFYCNSIRSNTGTAQTRLF